MNRKLFVFIILALSTTPLIFGGCSSSSEEQSADQASASDDGLDSGELSDDDGAKASSANPPAEGATESGDDVVADLGDDPTGEADPGALPDQSLGDQAATPPPADDANVPPPADSMDVATNDTPPEPPPPLTDESTSAPKASLKKIKDAPFNSNGRILNTVYVARKGDNLNKISEKLFGDKKRKKELIADNSFLSRGAKEGDKIYYNSPRRPDDTTTMMTYYEDNGVPSQSYVAQEGDDLKGVAKKLLGSREGWKELWTTNPNVESKGALDAGTELKYWSAGPEINVAANTAPPPPPTPPAEEMTPPPAAGTMQPPEQVPPPTDTLPPPPPAQDTAMLPPPPPPPQMAVNDLPPPPPPPPMAKKPAQSPESFLFQDQETTMALGAGAIILLSVILIIVHRIKKGRAQRMRLGQTQV